MEDVRILKMVKGKDKPIPVTVCGDVEAPYIFYTTGSEMAVGLSALGSSSPLPLGRLLVLIYV
jgi:hypothetical protein